MLNIGIILSSNKIWLLQKHRFANYFLKNLNNKRHLSKRTEFYFLFYAIVRNYGKYALLPSQSQCESAKSRGNVRTWVAWIRRCVGCVGQIFTWVAWVTWVKIFFTWVIIFTWAVWVKLFYVGQFFLRGSEFSAWVNFFVGV